MSIVKYFYENKQKLFDVKQTLEDSGWNIKFKDILKTKDLKLVDRNNSKHLAIVSSVTLDRLFGTYIVHYIEGGWQCLDNAINQFTLDERTN